MTYIVLTSENKLLMTQSDPIYRGDNMNKCITFLLPSTANNNIEMQSATVFLSYIRADGGADTVVLERESAMYNDSYYQYVLPITCRMSKYAGQVCLWLQIFSGEHTQPVVSKSGECIIRIRESKNMDDYMCDHQLTALYQMKKTIDRIVEHDTVCDNVWSDMSNEDTAVSISEEWENM